MISACELPALPALRALLTLLRRLKLPMLPAPPALDAGLGVLRFGGAVEGRCKPVADTRSFRCWLRSRRSSTHDVSFDRSGAVAGRTTEITSNPLEKSPEIRL